jgi:hypothetical protein
MILHVNHLHKGQEAAGSAVVAALFALLEAGRLDPRALTQLRVHLDWVQYRQNFREAVMVRRALDGQGEPLALAEIAVDLRQFRAETFAEDLARAASRIAAEGDEEATGRVFLEGFTPIRASIIWRFNRLFWQHLATWEEASGRPFEQALPGGKSDANHPAAVADAVADFWTLLRDMEKRGQLPPEVYVLEIGVGTGQRAALWLDRFRELDGQRESGFYPRLRFLLSDYSIPILDRAAAAVRDHPEVSFIALDALNPIKTLSFLRYKVLNVHLTNVYDNLPHDELVRRDGHFYLVEVRAYLPAAPAAQAAQALGIPPAALPDAVEKFLSIGPLYFGDQRRAVDWWRQVWGSLRLEERLVALEDLAEAPLPAGLDALHLEEMLREAPADLRFHLSSGAAESFANTLPLLHPRGYLQVQDIFVTSMNEYRQGFRGPGKLDGSVVTWVNGALLRAVGARAGYDVHFAPFHYRPESHTKVLYTTQRD